MRRIFQRWTTGLVAMAILIAAAIGSEVVSGQGRAAGAPPPKYQVVPLWPRPLNDQWILGSVTGVTVDAANHNTVECPRRRDGSADCENQRYALPDLHQELAS